MILEFTVTTYILDPPRVLLLHHPKHGKWLPPGGHLEPGETPPQGAKREVLEETGLEIELVSQENLWLEYWNAKSFQRPYLCLLEEIPRHGTQPAHQHMDLIYVGKVIGGKQILSESLRWFTLREVLQMVPDEEIFGETMKTIEHLLG